MIGQFTGNFDSGLGRLFAPAGYRVREEVL
jgi:hypothetical protein